MTLHVCGSCRRHHRDEGDGSCPFCTAQRPGLRNAWAPLAAAIALAGCHQEDDGRRAVAVYGGPTPPPALTADAGFEHPRNDAPAYGLAPDHRLTGAPDAGPVRRQTPANVEGAASPETAGPLPQRSPTPPPGSPDGGRR